jgi:hypothetical protein
MNNEFLDNKNFSYLINHVRNDVRQKSAFDIFEDKKYINLFKKLIQTIHTSNMNKRVSKEHLNSIVIDKCVPFLVKQIGDDKKKDVTFNINTPPIQTFDRPKSTRIVRKKKQKNTNSQNDFSNLTLDGDNTFAGLNNRSPQNNFLDNSPGTNPVENIMGKSSRDGEKIDFMKRMQEMENERNYNKRMEDENSFEKQVSTANEQQKTNIEDINKKNIRNDNDFFKQLYQNNMDDQSKQPEQENTPFQIQNQNYMAPLNENEGNLDSLYSNNDLNDAKDALDNEAPISQQDLDSYIRSRSEMPSNYEDNLSMSVNDSNRVNSEDLEPLLDKSLNNDDQTKEFMGKTLLSTNRVFERRKKRVLTIDISNFLQNVDATTPAIINYSNNYWEHFKVNFQEDFIVDKISDVFLESITINNPSQANSYSSLYKVLEISELNVKTTTNNNFMKDKFVLPNENTASSGSNKIMKYHLKSNYICTVNPQKIASLTFKLTDEHNDGVGVTLSSTSTTVNNNGGYKAGETGAVTVANPGNFVAYDAVYNIDKKFVGVISQVHNNDLYFQNGTHIPIFHGDKLYIPDSDYRTGVLSSADTDVGSSTVAVDTVDATTVFSTGDKVYLGNGAILGTLTTVAAQLLTFENPISHHVKDAIYIYKKSPLPKVFASDVSTNKIIMEFVFISR